MIVENQVEAYNIPSGILFDMHRDAAAQPARRADQGRPRHLRRPRPAGLRDERRRRRAAGRAQGVDFDGQEWLYFPAIVPQRRDHPRHHRRRARQPDLRARRRAARRRSTRRSPRATTAASSSPRSSAWCKAGSLRPHDVRVPGNLVDYIVVDPDQMQTTQTVYDPAISGEITQPLATFELAGLGPGEGHRAPRRDGAARTAMRSTSASASRPSCRASCSRKACTARSPGRSSRARSAACRCSASPSAARRTPTRSCPSPNQFTYFQGGGFDVTLLSFLQVDGNGSVNVSKLGAKPYLTAGCGGFVDITAHARRIVFSRLLHRRRQARGRRRQADDRQGRQDPQVRRGGRAHHLQRRASGAQRGQRVTYVTERCVIDLEADGWS